MPDDDTSKPTSDFQAAEQITALLRGRELPEQERIVRWVCESLGLSQPHARPSRDHAQTHAVVPPASPAQEEDAPTLGRTVDIRTFVQEKQPKSDVHFVSVVAYHHRFVVPESQRKDSITTDDLQAAARMALRPVFKTPSVPMNNAVQQGYMDRSGRGAYSLNAVGENLVAMTLPGAAASGAARGTKRRGARTPPSTRVKRRSKGKRAS